MHLFHLNVQQTIQHYGYAGVFLILLVEMVGIPFPAETTLTISGFEWSNGTFHLLPLILAAALGNILGSTIAYTIGKFLGRPVILWLGRYVGITAEKLDKAEARFQRSEAWVVILAKFIAGIRVLVPYLAGINKMRFLTFTLLNALSAVLWAVFFVVLGRYIGVVWTRYHQVFHHFALFAVLLVGLALVAYAFYRWRKRKKL